MNRGQTDNSYFENKVGLRLKHLPDQKDVLVLDCFHGKGLIWNTIKDRIDKNVSVLGIDKKKQDVKGAYLIGDNCKFLGSIELESFDVIDLDFYGIPYKQLEILFKRKYSGIVFVTFIQSRFGRINKNLLKSLGYTSKMIGKCRSLFNKNGFEKFKQYLALMGIKRIIHRSAARHHYVCFCT